MFSDGATEIADGQGRGDALPPVGQGEGSPSRRAPQHPDRTMCASVSVWGSSTDQIARGLPRAGGDRPVLVASRLAELASFARGRFVFRVGVGPGARTGTRSRCAVSTQRLADGGWTSVSRSFAGSGAASPSTSAATSSRSPATTSCLRPPSPSRWSSAAAQTLRSGVRACSGTGASGLGVGAAVRRVDRRDALHAWDAGRSEVGWTNGLNVWCGIDDDRARIHVACGMEAFYRIPFERFEEWSPLGPPPRSPSSWRRTRRRAAR